MEIKHNNKTYTLDVNKAIELGVLVVNRKPILLSDLRVGTLFLYISDMDSITKAIYIKTREGADRIAGVGELPTKVGDIVTGCYFSDNIPVSIYKDGKWVDTMPAI